MKKIIDSIQYSHGALENNIPVRVVKRRNSFVDYWLKNQIPNYNVTTQPRSWRFWKKSQVPTVRRMTFDKEYYTCSEADFDKILSSNLNKLFSYRKNVFDCDDISTAFKSLVNMIWGINNVGVVVDYSGGHAYNLVVFDTGKIKYLEPQTGEYVELADGGMYQLKDGVILL